MMAIADPVEAFALMVTIPPIDREHNTFGVVETGTLFTIRGRIFLSLLLQLCDRLLHNWNQ
jgi:hypothetical protein